MSTTHAPIWLGAHNGVARAVQPATGTTTAWRPSAAAAPLPIHPDHEFALSHNGALITSDAFRLESCRSAPDGLSLRTAWQHPSLALRVDLEYRTEPTLGVIRKSLRVQGRGLLASIELERGLASGARGPADRGEHRQIGMGPIGLGQPLFWERFFLGIEHPAAENWVVGDRIQCRLPLHWDLSTRGPYQSPPCVLGAAAPNAEVWDTFQDYIDRLRPHREPPFVTLINNWYQFGRPYHRGGGTLSGDVVLEELQAFSQLAREQHVPLDFYCLDDPWTDFEPDGGIWGHMSSALFPDGLPGLQAAARPLGIGLWVGPFGGYLGRHRLVPFGESLGYEAATDPTDDSGFGQRKLCCHGTRYHAHLRDSLQHWARAGVRYWKFDGVEFTCTASDHGHPAGPGAATHQMDDWIALMQAIRAIAPDSVISFTTGSNPSPWWLPHVDFLWRGGGDDRTTADDGPRRERFTTYIDTCLHLLRPTALPLAPIVAFGLIQNAAISYASETETLDDVARAMWHMVGRGSHHHDLYVSPDTVTAAQWKILTSALTWARARRHLLARCRMVLGDPGAGQVYGFLGWRDGHGVLSLRNPRGTEQAYTLHAGHAIRAIRSAYGPTPTLAAPDTLHGSLPPYGVAVMDLQGSNPHVAQPLPPSPRGFAGTSRGRAWSYHAPRR